MTVTEELLKDQKDLITGLELSLNKIDELDLDLLSAKVSILEELDEKGKTKFSNADKREQELNVRLPEKAKEYKRLKIFSEIQRYRINLNSQYINFLNINKEK